MNLSKPGVKLFDRGVRRIQVDRQEKLGVVKRVDRIQPLNVLLGRKIRAGQAVCDPQVNLAELQASRVDTS